MKISLSTRRRNEGSAVIITLALLFIMLLYSMANTRALTALNRELKALETQEESKFDAATNHTSRHP